MVKDIGHFIGGKHVKGTSGRFADIYNPNTGEVQARVALASPAELRAAVENAKAAQPGWAAKNPQVRARVMMRFLELARTHAEELATLISIEHGKTIPDALGDLQRGVEVVEFACGIPHLLKGEYSDGAGPGIDMYSMRQALGVVAGITPFNFPAMIPLWKCAPAIACGNAFIMKPSERDPSCPMRLAELFLEAGSAARHPQCRQWRQGGGRRHSRRSRYRRRRLRRLDADRPICLFARHGKWQAGAMLWRRQEPHADHARRRHGQGGGCADRRRLWLGWRALHGDLGCRAGGRGDGRRAGGEAHSARREAEGRPLHRPRGGLWPAGDASSRWIASRAISTSASRKAPR